MSCIALLVVGRAAVAGHRCMVGLRGFRSAPKTAKWHEKIHTVGTTSMTCNPDKLLGILTYREAVPGLRQRPSMLEDLATGVVAWFRYWLERILGPKHGSCIQWPHCHGVK